MNEKTDRKNIVTFNNVFFKKTSKVFNLKLFEGSQIVLKANSLEDVSFLGDIFLGTEIPFSGDISINTKKWNELKSIEMETLRAKIRRVFSNRGWISNLNLLENIELSELYHTKRKKIDIWNEVLQLSKIFDIHSILENRPFKCSNDDLKIMQWVRGMLGDFNVVVLEDPFIEDKNKNQLLFDVLNEKTKKGVVVIWLIHSIHMYKMLENEKIEIINIQDYLKS